MKSVVGMRKRAGVLVAVLAVISTTTACGSTAAGGGQGSADGGSGAVTFLGPDKALTAASASYTSVPKSLGYWKSEGLDVTVQAVDGATTAVQGVVTGNAMMTYASLASAVNAYQKDPSIRIIGATNGNIFQVVRPSGSGIDSVADLKGKTIGVPSLTSGSYLFAKGVIRQAGLDPESDVKFLPVGVGAPVAAAFKQGKIAAYGAWDSPNLVVGDMLGVEMKVLPSPLNDLTATSTLVVRKESIEKHPKTVSAMARGFFKALVFSTANPKAAVGIHWNTYRSSRPADWKKKSTRDQAVRILDRRLDITGGTTELGVFGKQPQKQVQRSIDTFAKYGIIGSKLDLDKADLLDYRFVEEYNRLNVDKIKKQAKSR